MMQQTESYRDLSTFAVAVKTCLAVYMAIAAVSLWSGWVEIELLQRAASGQEIPEIEAAASDSRQAFLGVLYMVVFALTGFAFLRFIYLSSKNARFLGNADMQFTPAWAVGWFFIPVVSLWKPYQAVKEIFKASHPDFDKDWEQAPTPKLLPLWWILWVIVSFVSQALFRSALRADTVDELLLSSQIMQVSDALDLPLGLVAILLVGKLQGWQSEKRRRLAAADTGSALTGAV